MRGRYQGRTRSVRVQAVSGHQIVKQFLYYRISKQIVMLQVTATRRENWRAGCQSTGSDWIWEFRIYYYSLDSHFETVSCRRTPLANC